ncbi:MAG: hypothetical protein AAF288_02935 [Planctomycetota bacterium]
MPAAPSATRTATPPDDARTDPQGRWIAPLTPVGRGPTAWALDWLALAAVLLIAVPPLVLQPAARDTHRVMENVSVGSSQETWLLLHRPDLANPESTPPGPAGVVPSWGGNPRLTKPPGLIWANLAATYDLTPDTAGPREVLARYRLLAAGLAGLMVAATFWAGVTLAGRSAGVAAAAVLCSMVFLFMKAGRTAAYDTHLAAWCTLAVAAGLWALRPTGPPTAPLRRLAGWSLGFVALTCALWTKGPVALVLVAPAWAAFALLAPGRRLLSLAAMLVATLGATFAFAGPYALMLEWAQPGSLRAMFAKEYTAERKQQDYQSPAYYLMLFGWVVPWTAYLVGGLLLPWIRVAGRARAPVWIALVWLGLLAVLLSIPGAKQERYAIPMLPPAALAVAMVLVVHSRLRQAGRPDLGAGWLYLPTVIATLGVILLLAGLLTLQPVWVRWGWLDEPEIDPAASKWWAVGLILPAGIALAAGWLWRTHRAVLGAVVMAVSIAMTGSLYWSLYARAQGQQDASLPAAVALNQKLGQDTLYELTGPPRTLTPLIDREAFLFGLRRIVPRATPSELRDLAQQASIEQRFVYVLAERTDADNGRMTRLGFELIDDAVPVDHKNTLRLWRSQPEAEAPAADPPVAPGQPKVPEPEPHITPDATPAGSPATATNLTLATLPATEPTTAPATAPTTSPQNDPVSLSTTQPGATP